MKISFETKTFSKALRKGIKIEQLLLIIALEKVLTREDMMLAFNLSERTLSKHLRDLESKGYIEKFRRDTYLYFKLKPEVDSIWD